jgi:hypothetical protein
VLRDSNNINVISNNFMDPYNYTKHDDIINKNDSVDRDVNRNETN